MCDLWVGLQWTKLIFSNKEIFDTLHRAQSAMKQIEQKFYTRFIFHKRNISKMFLWRITESEMKYNSWNMQIVKYTYIILFFYFYIKYFTVSYYESRQINSSLYFQINLNLIFISIWEFAGLKLNGFCCIGLKRPMRSIFLYIMIDK